MKVPCCSVCHTRYDEDERVPLLLSCGHGFCKACLTRMFSSSSDTSLSCPRCRHPTVVGNSVHALPKNFPILSLLSSSPSSPSFECDFTDDDNDGDEDSDGFLQNEEDANYFRRSRRRSRLPRTSENFCSSPIDLGSHNDLKLIKQLGEGQSSRTGQETWSAVLSSSINGRKCKHEVVVKRILISEDMDVAGVQAKLDSLMRASMWCRNVCAFHGAIRMDGYMCLVMDKYNGSIDAEMRQNNGRLTLEQILRYGADIARGVAELHAADVVCMNIKPSNLLFDENRRAVVSDYGLLEILKKPSCRRARSVAQEEGSSKVHSCMDCTMLSPHYTAPEAWEPMKTSLNLFWDDKIGSISPESDAWGFGCTLVEMCTGSVTWSGLSSEEIYRAVVKARTLPPQYASVVGVGIPRELWKMIGECLQFKPSRRPTFHAMLGIFLRHLQGIPRNHPASPDNDLTIVPTIRAEEPSPTSVLDVFPDNPNILHQLVFAGNVTGVRDFLGKAKNTSYLICSLLEAHDADGHTALHLACKRGSVELVETILEYTEADVNILDKDGDPPIVFALTSGSHECVSALINRSANVNAYVAHICASHGQPDCMRELLQAGADPNAVDDEGESLLHRAIAKQFTECAIIILENGGCMSMSILNAQRKTPLHLCVESWNVAVVRRWAELASQEQINEAIDIASPVGTALCMAASLKKDRESEGREMVRTLLAAGADPTAQDELHCRTALHIAAMVNDAELMKIILEAGVDVNVTNVQNTTPLLVALNKGANLCVGLLLSAGADCNLQDDDGDNAFHIAADAAKMIRENLNWIVVMLQTQSPAVHVRNHRGWTLRDYLESLPREWISEELMEGLSSKGVDLSPTIYEVGDWVKFRKSINSPVHDWQGATHKSVGFVQNVLNNDNLIVSFCTGEARVSASDVIKVIPLNRGQHVKLKSDVKEPRYGGLRNQSRDSIGTVLCVDDDGILRVGFPGASRGWRADPAEMERVEEFEVGDWVRIRPALTAAIHGLESVIPGSIGIVYSIRPDSSLLLDLCYLSNPWHCEPEEVEPVEQFRIGDHVCVKRSVAEPRYTWGGETHHSVGKIIEIESNGLLILDIPNRASPWQADPADMEKVENFKVGDWVRVKTSVPSPKYGWEDVTRNSIGVIHSLEDDGDMGIAFCFRNKTFSCSVADMEKVSPFEVGQRIHVMPSIAQPRLGWSNETPATIGTISRIDMDGTLNVKVEGRSTLWKVSPGDAERLSGFSVGDWVSLQPTTLSNPTGKDTLAIVQSIQDSGYLELAGCSRRGKWMAHYTEVEGAPSFKIGQHVRFRPGLTEPRWGWRGTSSSSKGIITGINGNGEVRVSFFGLPKLWRGDPADLEKEDIVEVGEWVRLKNTATPWRSLKPGVSIGVVYGISYNDDADVFDGSLHVSFCGEQDRWVGPGSELERVEGKVRFVVGQRVRIKGCVKQPRFGWSGHTHGSVGSISSIDADGKLRIFTPAGSKAWMIDPAEAEKVEIEEEIQIGDWVKIRPSITTPAYQWGDVTPSSIGVVHRKDGKGELSLAFCFMDRLWVCKEYEVEKIRAFRVGDKVRIKTGIVMPRWGWGMETSSSRGEVMGVDANGKIRIRFKWRDGRLWTGDPADMMLLDG